MSRVPQIFLLAAVLLMRLAVIGQVSAKEKTVTIEGTVVAEQALLLCIYGCHLSLIVRVDKPAPDKYVIVRVGFWDAPNLPRRGLPIQLVKKAERWKFFSTTDDGYASTLVLEQYWKTVDEKGREVPSEIKLPTWFLLDGAKHEMLPFGQSLPSYLVDIGKFRKIA